MAQLIKGMYGHEFKQTSYLFGIHCGQMRSGDARITRNSGWYNRRGEKLGWGDLSVMDFQRISRELEDGELFIILGESDSFWNFVERPGHIGSAAKTHPSIEAPGIDYVAENAMYIIVRNQFYRVDYSGGLSGKETWECRDLSFKVLSQNAAKDFIVRKSGFRWLVAWLRQAWRRIISAFFR